jgi:metallo-beta-lactamase family protein
MDQLVNAGRMPAVPVFVDSPLAVNATTVYGDHPECYDDDLQAYLLTDENPFGFNGLRYIRKVEESKKLNAHTEPCIIISASGMMNAGRVKHHLFNMIDNPLHTILLVGYASPETPGGRLLAGAQGLKLFGEYKPVRAHIETMDSFSAHGDQAEMIDFLKNQRQHVKKIFLVHGEIDRQEPFRDKLLESQFQEVVIPELGDEVELS